MKIRLGKTYIEIARIKEPQIDWSKYIAEEGDYNWTVTEEQYDTLLAAINEPAKELPELVELLKDSQGFWHDDRGARDDG